MAFDTWLFYTNAGYAAAKAEFSVVDTVAPTTGSGSATNWHNGFTIGSGIEHMLTRNWVVGFETNYYRFQNMTYEIGGGAAAGLYTWSYRPRDVYSAVGRVSFKW